MNTQHSILNLHMVGNGAVLAPEKVAALVDEEIVSRVSSGHTEVFSELVYRYEVKLLRYIRKFLYNTQDAEDCLQNVFVKAFQNINSFDTTKRFSPWIYRIAHNECVNFLKKSKNATLNLFEFDTLLPNLVAPENTENEAERAAMKDVVNRVVEKLDGKYKEVLVLYYIEDFDYKEISQILKIPVSTVGVRLKRAKESLQKKFREDFPEN